MFGPSNYNLVHLNSLLRLATIAQVLSLGAKFGTDLSSLDLGFSRFQNIVDQVVCAQYKYEAGLWGC